MDQAIRSRRALLAGAAGGAAALAANAALPASRALAVDQPLLLNVSNPATANTAVSASLSGGSVLTVENADTADGGGIWGKAVGGPGLAGQTGIASAGVAGFSGDSSGAPSNLGLSGVFGYSQAGDGQTTFGSGVWGVSDDIGVYGSGGTGVVGDGGDAGNGVEAYSGSGYALYVSGKVRLATRSGKLTVAKGKTSISRNVSGMTAGNIVIAVLQTPESGTWVRAAVAGAGKFTVYFNKALPSSSSVGWLVLN